MYTIYKNKFQKVKEINLKTNKGIKLLPKNEDNFIILEIFAYER